MDDFQPNLNFRILVIGSNEAVHDDFHRIFSSDRSGWQFTFDKSFHLDEGIDLIKHALLEEKPYAIVVIDSILTMNPQQILEIEKNIQIIIINRSSNAYLEKKTDGDACLFDILEARKMVYMLCDKWLLNSTIKDQLNQELRHIEHLAYYDALTGLPNRQYFKEILKHTLYNAERNKTHVGLFFLDIDNFRKINNTFGHEHGNELLRQVSKKIFGILRRSDYFSQYSRKYKNLNSSTAYLGANEFTIIFKDITDVARLRRIANRIIKQISASEFLVNQKKVKISVSVGISVYPLDTTDLETLIQNAEVALHLAKESGKNKFKFHNQKLNEAVIRKNLLEQEISGALERDEFFLVYQPKFSIADKTIIGFEGLLRWQKPEAAELSPLEFIPIAEESNLILEIDLWVLKKSCQLIAKLTELNLIENMTFSINISEQFFRNKDMIKIIEDEIEKNKISPKHLELEITESHLVSHFDEVKEHLIKLRNILGVGVKIAIDDFGVGYSSLSYLSEFPVNTLKIDKSFVGKISNNESGRAIVKSIIELAHNLKLDIVAEGVENDEQYEFLKKHRCDALQGFLFSKPIEENELISYIKNNKNHQKRKK